MAALRLDIMNKLFSAVGGEIPTRNEVVPFTLEPGQISDKVSDPSADEALYNGPKLVSNSEPKSAVSKPDISAVTGAHWIPMRNAKGELILRVNALLLTDSDRDDMFKTFADLGFKKVGIVHSETYKSDFFQVHADEVPKLDGILFESVDALALLDRSKELENWESRELAGFGYGITNRENAFTYAELLVIDKACNWDFLIDTKKSSNPAVIHFFAEKGEEAKTMSEVVGAHTSALEFEKLIRSEPTLPTQPVASAESEPPKVKREVVSGMKFATRAS